MDVRNEVILSMTGKIIAHTAKEDLETPFEANLRIPLMEDVFQISKNSPEPIQNNVSTAVETPVPVDRFKRRGITAVCLQSA